MQKYNKKKFKSQPLAECYSKYPNLGRKINRILSCGICLNFISDDKGEKRKLAKGNFCGDRFCAMCSWRKAKKDGLKIDVLMRFLKAEHKKEFIFLTLTAPNVPGRQLKNEIKKYGTALNNLMKHKAIKTVIKGYVKKLEITYNQERNDYHPHIHLLIAVNSSYFTDKTYLKQSDWLEHWQQVMQDETISQVHVERVKEKNNSSAVSEISKYTAKDAEYLLNQKIFDVFYNALKGAKTTTFFGLFTEANKKFSAGELDYLKLRDENIYTKWVSYYWRINAYEEIVKRDLTEEEFAKYNNRLIDQFYRDVDED